MLCLEERDCRAENWKVKIRLLQPKYYSMNLFQPYLKIINIRDHVHTGSVQRDYFPAIFGNIWFIPVSAEVFVELKSQYVLKKRVLF